MVLHPRRFGHRWSFTQAVPPSASDYTEARSTWTNVKRFNFRRWALSDRL
jgi:hypothetical protein